MMLRELKALRNAQFQLGEYFGAKPLVSESQLPRLDHIALDYPQSR